MDLIGVCSAEKNLQAEKYLEEFLAAGLHGEMKYLENPAMRTDPQQLLPGAQSVIVIAINYYREKPETPPDHGRVARYAWGRDYHKVLRKILKQLQKFLESRWPDHQHRICVDSAPLLEKAFAEQAGIGFYGKNTTLISQEFGSYILLGEIITTLPITPDPKRAGTCGSCTRCITACPTQALTAPGRMDARRCISYLTLESRSAIPEEFSEATGNLIAGCDICQEVCPYNKSFGKPLAHPDLATTEIAGDSIALTGILSLRSDEDYLARFAGSPLMRPKRRGLIRNALNAAGNAIHTDSDKYGPMLIPLITQIAHEDSDPSLRVIAADLLSTINNPSASSPTR